MALQNNYFGPNIRGADIIGQTATSAQAVEGSARLSLYLDRDLCSLTQLVLRNNVRGCDSFALEGRTFRLLSRLRLISLKYVKLSLLGP